MGVLLERILLALWTRRKNIEIVDKILADHVVSEDLREQAVDLRWSTRQNEARGGGKKIKFAVRLSKNTYTAVQSDMHFFTDKTMLPDTKKLNILLICTLWNQQGGVKVKSNNYIWKYYRERRKWKNSVFKTYKNSLRRQRQKSYYLHIFLVLEWNLMKRDENCVGEKNHISIRVDSLVFEFAKSKIISKGNSTWDRVTRTITHRIHTYAHFLRLLDIFLLFQNSWKHLHHSSREQDNMKYTPKYFTMYWWRTKMNFKLLVLKKGILEHIIVRRE